MDLDELLYEDRRNNRFDLEELVFEQELVTRKDIHNTFSVERAFVNSSRFHAKFEKLPISKEIQERVYKEAGRLLDFVDGQEEERAVAISARTGKFIVDNFEREGFANKTSFNEKEMTEIDKCEDMIIILHNHSHNVRPSGGDMLMYLHNEKVKLSIVVLHEGRVYAIKDVRPSFEDVYNDILENKKQLTTDIDEAKRLTTTEIYRINADLSERHKLFVVEEL